MEHDGTWLAKELTEVLDGWDLDLASSMAAAIDSSDSRNDADEIVKNFMDGNAAARARVHQFWDYKLQVESQDWDPQGPSATSSSSASRVGTSQSTSGSRQRPGSSRNDQKTRKASSSQKQTGLSQSNGQRQAACNSLRRGSIVAQALEQVEIRSDKQGKGKAKQKGVKKNIPNPSQPHKDILDEMERKILNCLSCGKIYDCRKKTTAIIDFLRNGGFCTFCGAPLDLRSQSSSSAQSSTSNARLHSDPASAAEREAEEIHTRAIELKNTLVDFDRNAEKRTTVIDDQSDFFEIDNNVWLSEQERKELRDRQRIEQEVAEEKKRRVRYTIDLVGRKVMIAEGAVMDNGESTTAVMAQAAANATAHEIPQGGGSGAQTASDTAALLTGRGGGPALQNMRTMPNPTIPGPAPVFMPSFRDNKSRQASASSRKDQWARGYGGRIQHDDVFAGFGEEAEVDVMFEDIASILNTQTEDLFDLCPDHICEQEAMPSLSLPERTNKKVSAGTRLSTMLVPVAEEPGVLIQAMEAKKIRYGEKLPAGMVHIRGWLSTSDQIKIIEYIRNLGIGPGGFYTPAYSGGATLNLKMMCLGKNWNLSNRCYEDIRSNHDGATPPPIPEFLKQLVSKSLSDASRVWGNKFENMEPNVCLCNFYSSGGALGLHQDKEEGMESCQRQIPVVSFSIGATGTFVFNKRRSTEGASSIDLESGDLLVFGGPSRMIYHGLQSIDADSSPEELIKATNMRKGRLNLTFRQYIPDAVY